MNKKMNIEKCGKKFSSLVIDASHDRIEIPLFVAKGKKSGPTLLILGGEHGTELTGPEIIRRFIEDVDTEDLAGTVIGFPVVNVPAVRTKQHSFPYDKWVWWNDLNNLNRAWPGNPDGNIAECITHKIFNDFILKADAVISFHSTNFAHYSEADIGSKESQKLCLDFGRIHQIRFANVSPKTSFKAPVLHGIPAILIELAPLREVNHKAISEGMTGLNNILISKKMKKGAIKKIKDQFIIDLSKPKQIQYISSVEDGILVREKPWGAYLKKGDLIGRIYDLYKYREVQKLLSPADGILFSTGPFPSHQTTFFMHTDSVCKGECVAEIIPVDKHIVNKNGDAWEDKLYFI